MTTHRGAKVLARLFGANSNFAREPLGFLSGFAIVLIWSGWYVVSRWGLQGNMTPADIILVRYLTGTILTLPMFWMWRNRTIPWRILPVLVLTYGFPYALTLFLGLRHSPAANAGILLNGLLPIVSAAFAWMVFKQNVGRGKWIAIALLACSNLLMLYAGLHDGSFVADWLWIVVSTLLLGWFMTTVRKWNPDMVVLMPIMSIGNLVLFLPFLPVLETNLGEATVGEITVQAFFQGFVNQVLVILLIPFTVNRIGSVSTSVLYGFVPVATALFGWVFLAENLGMIELFAIFGCTAGIIAFARAR